MVKIISRFFAFCGEDNRRRFHQSILLGVLQAVFEALKIPAIACMAEKDELVSLRSVKEMAGNPAIEVRYLPGSHHHEFAPEDKAALLEALREMAGI